MNALVLRCDDCSHFRTLVKMFVFALCFVAALGVANGGYQPICQPSRLSNASEPKLPNLPSSFSTLVEATSVKNNHTAIYFESYDQKAKKGRSYHVKDGVKHIDIYDYALDEIIHIDDDHCTVSSSFDTGHGHFIFFDLGEHIESVSQLFRFGREYNETYMGVANVRGIRCHHWRSCISTNYSSYYLDYYFSVPGWVTPRGLLNSTVIRATVNGTSLNVTYSNGNLVNETHDFFNVYDFIDFHPGPQDPSTYQIPEGVYCEGYKGANKTKPKLPPVFSMELEMTSKHFNVVFSMRETYDLENKLAVFMHPNWWNPTSGTDLVIHDFNTGIGYNISGYHGRAMCSLFNLTKAPMNWDVTEDESHHIRMKTTQEIFEGSGKNGSSRLMYKGLASVRGIIADIWTGKMSFQRHNKTYEVVSEWYFARPSWHFESIGYSQIQHQVPIRSDWFSSTMGQFRSSVFNFNPSVDPRVFDIKPCFTLEEQRLVRFSLRDPQGKLMVYAGSTELLMSLSKAVGRFANVSIIRVNGMKVLEYKKEELVVSFVMLDRPKATGGDVSVVYPEKGLMDGLDALNASMTQRRFQAKFQNGTLNAIPYSFVVGFVPSPPAPQPQPPPTTVPVPPRPSSPGKQTKGVSSGLAAGISILMLVVGIGGGLVIAHVIMKRRGTGLFQYEIQA